MPPELCIYTRTEMVEVLAQLYASDPASVAAVCDEALDKSGRLLGDVRAKARSIRGADPTGIMALHDQTVSMFRTDS